MDFRRTIFEYAKNYRRRLTSEITGPLRLGEDWRSQTKPRVNGSEFIDLLGGVSVALAKRLTASGVNLKSLSISSHGSRIRKRNFLD